MEMSEIISLFGWMSVIHIIVLSSASLLLVAARKPIARLHSSLLGVPEAELPSLYFSYLGHYKIIALCTAIAPYVALRLI